MGKRYVSPSYQLKAVGREASNLFNGYILELCWLSLGGLDEEMEQMKPVGLCVSYVVLNTLD